MNFTENNTETIKKVWFSGNRIFIETNGNKEYSRPLEAFPRLLEADDKERNLFEINSFSDAIRWENIDEDIHISSFFIQKEPNRNNPIARIFEEFPQLNMSQVAQSIGINKSLMAQYIYGIKTPSENRQKQITDYLHHLGEKLQKIAV